MKKGISKRKGIKKQAIKQGRAKQDKPFTYFTSEPFAGFINPSTGHIPLKEYCQKLLESNFRNDEGLRFLVWKYRDALGKSNQEQAIDVLKEALVKNEFKFSIEEEGNRTKFLNESGDELAVVVPA